MFHKALKDWFSKNEANAQFTRFWNQRAGAGSAADTHDLREYMEEQGVDLTTTTKNEIIDKTMGFFEWFGDTANWLRGIVIGALIVGVAVIAYVIIQFTKKGGNPADLARPKTTGIESFKYLP